MKSTDNSLLEKKKELEPHEFALFLKSLGPFFWWEKGKFWVVTDYKLAETVLKSSDYSCDRSSFFISRMPNLDLPLIKDFFGVISKMMVMSDAPSHTSRRKIASLGLTDERMDYFRPFIDRTVSQLIQQTLPKGEIEFVEDIAKPLPSMILADLFAIPEKERNQFYQWSNNMTQFFGGASQYRNEDGIEVNDSTCGIRDYFASLIKKRRENPQKDFLSGLLQRQNDFALSDEEIISQAIMMLVAGQVTTSDQLCNNLFTLLSSPSSMRKLQNEPHLLPLALEELNRWDPAVTFLFRVVKEPTVLSHTSLAAGDVIFISAHAANRDASIFESPDILDITRRKNPHLAYGLGSHVCLGAKLARIQMTSCFSQLLSRFPKLRIASKETSLRKHHSLAFSGFETLLLKWD